MPSSRGYACGASQRRCGSCELQRGGPSSNAVRAAPPAAGAGAFAGVQRAQRRPHASCSWRPLHVWRGGRCRSSAAMGDARSAYCMVVWKQLNLAWHGPCFLGCTFGDEVADGVERHAAAASALPRAPGPPLAQGKLAGCVRPFNIAHCVLSTSGPASFARGAKPRRRRGRSCSVCVRLVRRGRRARTNTSCLIARLGMGDGGGSDGGLMGEPGGECRACAGRIQWQGRQGARSAGQAGCAMLLRVPTCLPGCQRSRARRCSAAVRYVPRAPRVGRTDGAGDVALVDWGGRTA